MEDIKELYKLYIYIEGGNDILKYDDLHVLINKKEYKYDYNNFSLFDDGDKLTLTSSDGSHFGEDILCDAKLDEDYVNDLCDLDRVKEIYKIRSKIDSLQSLDVELQDNIIRANPFPEYVNKPQVVREPNRYELTSVFDYFKEHFAKGLILQFLLMFFFLSSFIYYDEGEANKIITRVLGITNLVYFISYLTIFIYSYIKYEKEEMNNWKNAYNNYLEAKENYDLYLKKLEDYHRENSRIEETKRRLKSRTFKEIKTLEGELRVNLNILTDDFISDYHWSTKDYSKLIKLMEEEDIDFVDDAIDRWNELYVLEDETKQEESYDYDEDYEDDEETERYIRDGSLGRNEFDEEIVGLLREQNRLLKEQKEEDDRKELFERLQRLKEESKRRSEEEALKRKQEREEEERKKDTRIQCNSCANRGGCPNINKAYNCPRYVWYRNKC